MFDIAAFYLFVDLDDCETLKENLRAVCVDNGVKGTILVASEGINGTIAGPAEGVTAVLDFLSDDTRFDAIDVKHALSESDPFARLKVRVKKEIVTLGAGAVDCVENTGNHVSPLAWNEMISDPDTIVIDTRNTYEVDIGTFKGAINPATSSFREFPAWVDAHPELRGRRIAMFCTGGVRCEKATAYLKENGFDDVHQLEGGILRYLETVEEPASTWNGECYVFDRRVSVGHGLVAGDHEICPNCNTVLDRTARQTARYRTGICCADCHHDLTPRREARFAERQRQIELARDRGGSHFGQSVS